MIQRFAFAVALAMMSISATASTITVVVPNPPGGLTDTFGRSITRYLSQALQRDMVVVNKGGADGRVATDYVISQPSSNPHILIASSGTTLFNRVLTKTVVHDYTQFDHMVPMVRVPLMFAVSSAMNVTTWDQFLHVARSRPLNCAGSAASNGFVGRYIMKKFKIDQVQFVPFKGSGDMIPQIISGNLDCAFDSMLVLNPLHRESRLRVIAVSSQTSHPAAPGMPLFSDIVPALTFYSWAGVSVSRNYPAAEREKLFAALRSAHRDSTHRSAMMALGLDVVDEPSSDIAWLNNEYNRFEMIRQQIGLAKE